MRQDAAQQAYDRLMAEQRENVYSAPVETEMQREKRWETLKIRRRTGRFAPA